MTHTHGLEVDLEEMQFLGSSYNYNQNEELCTPPIKAPKLNI